jgi:hypothetical protein
MQNLRTDKPKNPTEGDYDLYPSLLREVENSSTQSSSTPMTQRPRSHSESSVTNASKRTSVPRWDLYPKMIRDIENSGTEEQRKLLHKMEGEV